MRLRLTALATRDLEAAYEHYATIESALGDRFLDDVDAVMARLQMFPRGAPPVEGFADLRRARLRHFPYGLFYREGSDLVVLRVLHARRDRPRVLVEEGP